MLQALRYTYDRLHVAKTKEASVVSDQGLFDHLLSNSVRVRRETFPRLAGILQNAYERVAVERPFPKPELFIRPDPTLQACCYTSIKEHAVIMATSSMVERLKEDEMAFVIGHEMGHWLYNHEGTADLEEREQSVSGIKRLASSRCAEISADRIGLLACRDSKAAISALIKISTGLDEGNLRMDIQSFLKQYKELVERGPSPSEAMSTHPFFLLRIRSIVLFSRSQIHYTITESKNKKGTSCEETDEVIHRDMRKISGLSLEDIDNKLVEEILILASFVVFAHDKKISKEEQAFFKDTFGEVDMMPYVKLAQELGIKGLSLKLRQKMSSLGGVSSENENRMKTFFSVLNQTFPNDHTASLRCVLNGIGFV